MSADRGELTREMVRGMRRLLGKAVADAACSSPRSPDFERGKEWVLRRLRIRVEDYEMRVVE